MTSDTRAAAPSVPELRRPAPGAGVALAGLTVALVASITLAVMIGPVAAAAQGMLARDTAEDRRIVDCAAPGEPRRGGGPAVRQRCPEARSGAC